MTGAGYFLGTHQPGRLDRLDVPVFVSHRTLRHPRRLPTTRAPWGLDSDRLTDLAPFDRWQTSPAAHVEAVARYQTEVSQLAWASPQDWMCDPATILGPPTRRLVEQRRWVLVSLPNRDVWDWPEQFTRRWDGPPWLRKCSVGALRLRHDDAGSTPVKPAWPLGGAVGQRTAELRPVEARRRAEQELLSTQVTIRTAKVRAAKVRSAKVREPQIHTQEHRAAEVRAAEVRVQKACWPEVSALAVWAHKDDLAADVCPSKVQTAQVQRRIGSKGASQVLVRWRIGRRGRAADEDGERGLHLGGTDAQLLRWLRGRVGRSCASAVQEGDQHLGHRQAVVGRLPSDLLQPVDAAEPDFEPVAAELVDRAGEPLTGLALQGQRPGGVGLLAVVAELLEGQDGAGKDGQPGDGLQRRGTQIVLEFEAGIGQLQTVTILKGTQRLGRQGRGEPARKYQHPRRQQPDDGYQPQDQQNLKWPAGSGQPVEPGKHDESKQNAAGRLGPPAAHERAGQHCNGTGSRQGQRPPSPGEPPTESGDNAVEDALPCKEGSPQQRCRPQHTQPDVTYAAEIWLSLRRLIHRSFQQWVVRDERSVLDFAARGNHYPHYAMAWRARLVLGPGWAAAASPGRWCA